MLNLNSILLSSDKPRRLIEFYEKVLEKKSVDWGEGDWGGFEIGNAWLTIGPHDQVKGNSKEPQRLMFNFETDDVPREFDRIKALGAKVIADPYQPEQEQDMWIATFQDPDGNYFQLMTPMK